ncbi:hypothetical protein GOP47_0022150, partial [Adiantum capillus-veneris]
QNRFRTSWKRGEVLNSRLRRLREQDHGMSRIRFVLSGIDAKLGLGSTGAKCVSGSWCWAWATWVRGMGGGPRTFPGGVTKWQWKRMLMKRRQERECHRLAREKMLYDMRQRAEVLAAHPELLQPWEKLAIFPPPGISTGQQVSSLVRRFCRPSQAEDLWTQRDGPQQGTTPSSVDVESANVAGLDAATSDMDALHREAHRSPLQRVPYSARWQTMDFTPSKKKKKEASPIGKSMQDYLDAFDTDPLGVAVEIDTDGGKREALKDPLGYSVDERETSKKKDKPKKKKPGKGGRRGIGR